MLQPVASTSPLTVPAGLIFAAVILMASRKNPVGVQVTAASACWMPVPNRKPLPATLSASATAAILDIPVPFLIHPVRAHDTRPSQHEDSAAWDITVLLH